MATTNLNFFEKVNQWIKQSISIKLFTIGFLILILMIPISMVERLISDRESTQHQATEEIGEKWGEEQTIAGLILNLPYKKIEKVYDNEDEKKGSYKLVETISYIHFLPDLLNITGDISPEKRYRGIYEVIVYNSKINISGNFSAPNFEGLKIDKEKIIWDDASLSLGMSDLRSIQENISVKWNDKDYFFDPGVESEDVIDNGISTRIKLNPKDSNMKYNFSLNLNINGSNSLKFVPLGMNTNVKLKSKWENPSFVGSFLPDKREVTKDGFLANWDVLHLNRTYPQRFEGEIGGILESSFGVDLIVPVDEYQKSTRSAKYAIMLISLTFLIFFFAQILNGVRIHPIQYLIVGLALCVFYTLLIGLSEHISFNFSYFISTIAIVGLISLYAHGIFKKKMLTGLICLILVMLYLFIFMIIQLEDYALLMGSIGLFFILSTIMILSRKINWYDIKVKGDAPKD